MLVAFVTLVERLAVIFLFLAADHLGLEGLLAQQLFALVVFLAAGCRQNINAVGIPRPVALQDHLVPGRIADIGAEFGRLVLIGAVGKQRLAIGIIAFGCLAGLEIAAADTDTRLHGR